jgi:hypothetical protein
MASVRDWESRNAQSFQEREAQLQREQEEAELLTYTREDAYSMVRSMSASTPKTALSLLGLFKSSMRVHSCSHLAHVPKAVSL